MFECFRRPAVPNGQIAFTLSHFFAAAYGVTTSVTSRWNVPISSFGVQSALDEDQFALQKS
jgi:hypothetical protein